jgi:hypothetical protein
MLVLYPGPSVVTDPLAAAAIEVWLVSEDGTVVEGGKA